MSSHRAAELSKTKSATSSWPIRVTRLTSGTLRREQHGPDEGGMATGDAPPPAFASRPSPRMALAAMSGAVCSTTAPTHSAPDRLLFSGFDLPQQVLGHDDALDLIGSLVDLGDFGVAHEPLHREVLGEPVAAEQLHRVDRDAHRRV